jgi:hypothetical protein
MSTATSVTSGKTNKPPWTSASCSDKWGLLWELTKITGVRSWQCQALSRTGIKILQACLWKLWGPVSPAQFLRGPGPRMHQAELTSTVTKVKEPDRTKENPPPSSPHRKPACVEMAQQQATKQSEKMPLSHINKQQEQRHGSNGSWKWGGSPITWWHFLEPELNIK